MNPLRSPRRFWRLPSRLLGLAAVASVAVPLAAAAGTGTAPVEAAATAATATLTLTPARPGTSPPPLAYAAAAYDADNGTVVLFGGSDSNGTVNDNTWIWDGSDWTERPGSSNTGATVPARRMASLAFDPTLHELILFGGEDQAGDPLGDTWAWNGSNWFPESPVTSPPPRQAAAMAYDAAGDLVLFGGTGEAGLTGGPTSTTTTPPGSAGGAAEAAGQPVVLGDTWVWNGTTWVQVQTGPAPPARSGASIAWDSADATTVLFGGESTPATSTTPALDGDTWVWNGFAWSEPKTAAAPSARFGSVFADEPTAGGPVLLGGEGPGGGLPDGWVWASSGWQTISTNGPIVDRTASAFAADAARRDVVVVGGIAAGGGGLSDTELVTASTPPPAVTTPTTPTTLKGTSVRPVPPAATTTTAPPHPSPPTTVTSRGSTPPATIPAPTGTAAPPTTLHASLHTVRRGWAVVLTGSGFRPGSPVVITFHSVPTVVVGRATADSDGRFSVTVGVPRSAVIGDHHFMATGTGSAGTPAQLTAAVVVVPVPGHHRPGAAVTASLVALALVIPGGTWMAMAGSGWRRRRSGSAAS